MAEKTKEEELKQKLIDFFDKKLTDLTTNSQSHMDSIQNIKYEIVDTLFTKFKEVEEEHKKQELEEKERIEKEKHDKKTEEGKHEKVQKSKIDPTARPKTPMALGSTRKTKIKEDKHETKEKKETKAKVTIKAPASSKGAAGKKTDASKRPKTAKDTKSRANAKKGGANAKKGAKGGGKKDAKKAPAKEEEHHEVEEEKKPVVINPAYIYTTNDELKNNPGLSCMYFVLKGKYIVDKKQFLHITTFSPLLYKTFGSNMKFLLDDKLKDVKNKANEIEKFLNNYGDLNNYLSKEFSLSKKAINSIQFFKKKEEDEILKMSTIPKEVGLVLKCLYYILDENFDESISNKELFENMLNNVLTKNEDKTFKSLIVNYVNQNKFLNLDKEKFDKINNIINENNTITNMIALTKLCRPISLFCFLLKEVHDYINLKTLDGQFYFDLRMKNNELQKYKDIIYMIENNGKKREEPKEEKKEELPKVEEQPKKEEPKTEEQPKTEEPPKVEEQHVTEEQPKTEEASNPEGGEQS